MDITEPTKKTKVLISAPVCDDTMWTLESWQSSLKNLEDGFNLYVPIFTDNPRNYEIIKNYFPDAIISTWWKKELVDKSQVVNICIGRNMAVDHAKAIGASHLVFIDTDIIVPSNSISKLVNVNWPLVAGLVFGRIHGDNFVPHIFSWHLDGYPPGAHYLRDYNWAEINAGKNFGIIEADGAGIGFSCIAREVFEKQYFRSKKNKYDPCELDETAYYCIDFTRNTGKRVRVDTSVVAKHFRRNVGDWI